MAELTIAGGRLFYWDPRRNRLPLLRRFEIGPRVGNFGDLLGPLIVRRILEQRSGGSGDAAQSRGSATTKVDGRGRVLALGSVMHFAEDGDTIWGTGVNGKMAADLHRFSTLDVRAVRGPLTREWLTTRKGIGVDEVYGDPALLLPSILPEATVWLAGKKRTLGVVPNFHDVATYGAHPGFIDPRRKPMAVLEDIVRSEMVAASSLHGVIVAEAFGIPAVLLPAKAESPFKYLDYAQGTGRESLPQASGLTEAEVALRRSEPALSGWSPEPLLNAFPLDRFPGA